jgi:hypothetical protein
MGVVSWKNDSKKDELLTQVNTGMWLISFLKNAIFLEKMPLNHRLEGAPRLAKPFERSKIMFLRHFFIIKTAVCHVLLA